MEGDLMNQTVIGFIEADPSALPVIAMAGLLADVLSASVEAVHVGDESGIEVRDIARTAGVPIRVIPGDPIEQIVAEMSSGVVQAGAMGARGQPGGPRPAGHTALNVITRVDQPIAVVPPQAKVPTESDMDRILIPLDGTPSSAEAVDRLCEAFAQSGVEIVVLHVFDESTTPRFWDQPHYAAEAFGDEFLARFMRHPGARVSLRSGAPREGVLDAASRESVDVIALGWSQSLVAGHAEVVRHVLSESPVPVLLIPTP
jgi:nucleotide-binding universal stress UspA family protein